MDVKLCSKCGVGLVSAKSTTPHCNKCRAVYKKQRYANHPRSRASQIVSSMMQRVGKLSEEDRLAAIDMIVSATECRYCKFPANGDIPIGLDHVIPIAQGGANELNNLAPCCKICNIAKNTFSAELYELWLANIKDMRDA